MAVNLSKKDQDALDAAGKAWQDANARGDKAAMDAAHKQAESIRNGYGYSGGSDGSQYIPKKPSAPKPPATGGYTPKGDWSGDRSQDSWVQDQLKGYGDAYNNATTDAERQAAHDAAEALREKYGYSGGVDGSENILLGKEPIGSWEYDRAPTYEDNYSSRIDDMLNQILNRDKFDYNALDDPLYQQYKQQYQQEGQRAMQDTLGAVSARTGGLASSYATTAANQTNQQYMAQLANKIPELYQLAYSMYLDDIDLQVQDLGLLNGASDREYGRYRDTMSDWRNDRDFAYGVYRDDIGDDRWKQEFDYGMGRDQIMDGRWDKEWNYGLDRDKIEDDRYNREWEYKLQQDALEAAMKKNGNNNDDSDPKWKPKDEADGDDSGFTGDKDNGSEDLNIDMNSVLALGYGPITPARLNELVELGEIEEIVDGNTIRYQKRAKPGGGLSFPNPFG